MVRLTPGLLPMPTLLLKAGHVSCRLRALLCYTAQHVDKRRPPLCPESRAVLVVLVGPLPRWLQEMPEFMLPFLIFLLAHHPDYPTQEVGGAGWFHEACALKGRLVAFSSAE